MKNAATDAKRLAAADEVRAKGDIAVAATIYLRMAVRRPPNASSIVARQRLEQLRADGRERLKAIDSALAGKISLDEPDSRRRMLANVERHLITEIGQLSDDKASSNGIRLEHLKNEIVRLKTERMQTGNQTSGAFSDYDVFASFKEYDQLAWQFRRVPKVGDEIRVHVRRQRRRPEYAAILQEPKGKQFLVLAKQHEHDGQLCCAYRSYEEAAKHSPAPSSKLALERLAEMKRDQTLLASVKTCRELEWCHKAYERAERLAKVKPSKARQLFSEIAVRAPADSEIARAAKMRI